MSPRKRGLLSEGWSRPAAAYLVAFLVYLLVRHRSSDDDHSTSHATTVAFGGTHTGGEEVFEASGPLECGPRELEHLSDLPARGLHVLSLAPNVTTVCSGDEASSSGLSLAVHVDGYIATAPVPLTVSCQRSLSTDAWLLRALRDVVRQQRPRVHSHLRKHGLLQSTLGRMERERLPPLGLSWRMFTPFGTALSSDVGELLEAFAACRTLYVYEGGVFVWPGVREGHRLQVPTGDPTIPTTTLTTLSLQPRVFAISPLLTEVESGQLIRLADQEMTAGRAVQATGGRTSSNLRLRKGAAGGQGVVALETRAHRVLHIQPEHFEPFEVLRYRTGERYRAHYDYFTRDKFTCDSDPETARLLTNEQNGAERNRVATILWYLSSHAADGGGETHFPLAELRGPGQDAAAAAATDECGDGGLRVIPQLGKATLWYNLRPDGAADPSSKHSGCAPRDGTVKWAMNLWLWSAPIPTGT